MVCYLQQSWAAAVNAVIYVVTGMWCCCKLLQSSLGGCSTNGVNY